MRLHGCCACMAVAGHTRRLNSLLGPAPNEASHVPKPWPAAMASHMLTLLLPLHTLAVPWLHADSDEFLPVATTRPETILGDTAVAVHPEDER